MSAMGKTASTEKDLERNHVVDDVDSKHSSPAFVADGSDFEDGYTANPRTKEIQNRFAPLRYLVKGEDWLDAKMGIETQGIDLIKEEDKQPPHLVNSFFIWWSMTCHVGTLPLGLLGPEIFYLNLNQSVAAIVVGTLLGAMCTAYCGTLGPRTGLRAIATSRYSFGFWGAKLCSVLNVLIGSGFAIVNVVVCGQLLSAVSDFKMTISVGCVIITVLSYVISIFGFKIIHTFEKYSWIAGFILLCVMIGQCAPHMDSSSPGATGIDLAGGFLSFMAICFSSSSGWCSIASDYYCNYPANTKSWKIFVNTFCGVTIPTIFVTVIGACVGNAAFSANDFAGYPPYADAYESGGLGGLIGAVYHPSGWSKFCLVILTFSVLGNNIAVFYSSGLSIQLLGHWSHAIPRFIWSAFVAVIIGVCAVAGKDHLSVVVSNFVSLLGYWTISFTFILLIEDKVFRRRDGYNLAVWDRPHGLPWGAAAITALLAGYLAGGVPGMAQTWYVGAIALKFGPYGGDVGIFMSGAITLCVYPLLRYLEKKHTGR
ncbi:permease for cytosine/purines, uracil, thiamine, allantoin-domain-containing protein [Calycina marina]|uniref:Permease for cytosine/purines, uracil, thiamine, allantoin-domain-containing protein n=1 Tax=Calycina marina TaxID=1763456 RepID=A0A9P8CBU8_9HELO|nr:permease for cytosine/purines, uracil, thiamine, allantoin-domain-containing protein [Calycina marina]